MFQIVRGWCARGACCEGKVCEGFLSVGESVRRDNAMEGEVWELVLS